MDIYTFINSKDIRDYLKKIHYNFTPVEAAWLVWQCESITLQEKHNAWNEIIETTPDVSFETNKKSYDSLHKFLNEYMELENKCIDDIVNPKDSNLFYKSSIQVTWDFICKLYFNYENCLNATKKDLFNWNTETGNNVCISMWHENEPQTDTYIELNTKGEIMHIHSYTLDEINRITFEDAGLIFPTPFVNGDILWNPLSIDKNPFVLEEPYSDMSALGYSTGENGQLYKHYTTTYMNVEYYNYKLAGINRILGVLSAYLKGEIDIVRFVNMYQPTVLENYADTFEM